MSARGNLPKKLTRKAVEARRRTFLVRFSGTLRIAAESEVQAEREATSRIFSDTITIDSVDEVKKR